MDPLNLVMESEVKTMTYLSATKLNITWFGKLEKLANSVSVYYEYK